MFTKCAQQTQITGGEKDTTPPMVDTLKMEEPRNGSVNFSSPNIVIHFNELIALKNPDKQIIITPFLEKTPEIYTKGKKLMINFQEPLQNNTTYIINFGDAIVDNTEGNVFSNYKYVFSTGSFIDSLEYKAFVFNAFTKKPEKDILVLLYQDESDSVVQKKKPTYFGKTNAQGLCNIQNIAEGNFKVVALEDKNGDYKFQIKEEKIGFINNRFDAQNDTITDTIGVFSHLPKTFEITTSVLRNNGKGLIVVNHRLDTSNPIFEDSVLNIFLKKEFELSSTEDSIFYWINPKVIPQPKYGMIVQGSKKVNTNIKLPVDSSLTFTTNALDGLKPQEDLFFVFSQPIEQIDESKISILKDGEKIPFECVQTSLDKIVFASAYDDESTYTLEALPGAVSSYYGLQNDTIGAIFERNKNAKYGNIMLSVEVNERHSFILELLQNDNPIISKKLTAEELKKVDFTYLKSGKYALRLIFDKNENGFWDTGDYYKNLYPERIEYYAEPIDLKTGWDIEIKWEFR